MDDDDSTHSDGDSKTRASEEEMMTNIFKYIDKLFNMARPKRLIYMAIDG
jgi:5'-3' exonuclease